MIRDLLVHVDGTRGGRDRLAYAIGLAALLGARLTGLHVTPPADLSPIFKPSAIPHALATMDERLALDAQAAEHIFKAEIGKNGIHMTWHAATGHMAPVICAFARYADLVILGQYEREEPPERHPLSLAEAVSMDCGRPVLVLPSKIDLPDIRRALIAWDGSREAVRAVHDALSLLQTSKAEVAIVTINDEAIDLEPLIGHLEQHRIPVVRQVHEDGSRAPGRALKERMRDFDLLIMGAFGRPAWVEFLFGGTTTSVLLNSSIPVFISH